MSATDKPPSCHGAVTNKYLSSDVSKRVPAPTMASLYTHIFAHRAALHRTSFHHSLVGATRPLWKTSVLSAPRASSRPLNNRAAASRVAAAVRWSGTGLASAGLALSLYNNSQNLNCERGSIPSPPNNEFYAENWHSWHCLVPTAFEMGTGIIRPIAGSPTSSTVQCQYV